MNETSIRKVCLKRSSNFPGFGMYVSYDHKLYVIRHIEYNSPAEQAGLQAHDIIVQVNGQWTKNMSYVTFVRWMEHKNSKIHLVVRNMANYL